MTFRSLEEWLLTAKDTYSKANMKYQDDDITIKMRIADIDDMINKDILSKLGQAFKDSLLENIDTYSLDNFIDWKCKHFYMVRGAITINQILNYQYTTLRLPFGDDEEKYRQRIEVFNKKKTDGIPMLSPKDNLSFFKNKWDRLLHSKNFHNLPVEKRQAQKFKAEMIDALLGSIVIGNYSRDFKGTIRLTQKSKGSYILTSELTRIIIENNKRTIPYNTYVWLKEHAKHKLG